MASASASASSRCCAQAGYERPIWLHGALRAMTDYYVSRGFDLGEVPSVTDAPDKLAGEIVLSPPSALGDRWSRRFADPLAGFASGWMRIRGRVRQRGVELPLIISDHCDWPELLRPSPRRAPARSGSRMAARRRWCTRWESAASRRARCASSAARTMPNEGLRHFSTA